MSDIVEGLLISGVGAGAVFGTLAILMFVMMGVERVFRSDGVAVEELVAVEGEEARVGEGLEDTAEVAAIALALASYMKERGKELGGRPIAVGGVHYQVEVGDLSRSPVAVVVNGRSHWASVDGEGLPVTEQIAPVLGAQMIDIQRGRNWRSAYPLSQGGYWDRWGWGGRGGLGAKRE
jgi:Na+-transporting methylmalonyl-CoA/oxaloacetate decarboxylase gamma subunit